MDLAVWSLFCCQSICHGFSEEPMLTRIRFSFRLFNNFVGSQVLKVYTAKFPMLS